MEWTLRDAGIPGGRVEVAALTGGSILAGADVFAEVMRNDVARTYVMVGGAGHTTETFRARPAAAAGIAPPELAHAQGAAPINAGPPHTFQNERQGTLRSKVTPNGGMCGAARPTDQQKRPTRATPP